MIDEIVTMEVKCYLTEAEKIEKGKQLAEHVSKIEVLTEERADNARQYKTKIDGHNLDAIGLSDVLKNGFEMRQVECKMVKNYALRMIDFIAIGTGELIQTRPFGAGDDQIGMFDGGNTFDSISIEMRDGNTRKGKITKLGS